MRKILSVTYLVMILPLLKAEEEKQDVPDFRPAQVAPNTNGLSTTASTNRPPDGMTQDLEVALDETVSLNKIYTFVNDRRTLPPTNPKLAFERKYWNHGAILNREYEDRQGNYFVINWQNDGSVGDFTVRLDYRQANTRERVMTKTEEYKNFGGYEKTVIKVVGDEFLRGGVVNSWRVSIVRDGKIIAQEKSFIW